MRYDFDYAIINAINNAIRTVKASPLVLGATSSGVGGPIGGYIGYLSQKRVSYDASELSYSGFYEPGAWNDGILVSGSLMDNLAHIRYRLDNLEASGGGGSGGGASSFIDLTDTPSDYSGFAGYVLQVNGTEDGIEFAVASGGGGGGTPGGSDTEIQFNDSGSFGGDSEFTWDTISKSLGIGDYGILPGITPDHTFWLVSDDVSPAQFMATYGTSYAPYLAFMKADGTSSSPTNVKDGQVIGRIRGRGYNGSSWSSTQLEIRIVADGDWAVGDHPTRLELYTTPVGSSTLTLALTLSSDGNVDIASGKEYQVDGSQHTHTASDISGNNFFIDQSGGTSDTFGALSGTIDGSNTTFTVSQGEYISGSLKVYLNGQLQTQGSSEDWSETDHTTGVFDFAIAPDYGDEITADYMVAQMTSDDADTLDGQHASSFAPASHSHAVILSHPSGRLSLASGLPITTSDQSAKASIYYVPHIGDVVPIYDGSDWSMATFTELTLGLDSDSGHTGYHQSGKVYDLFVYNDGGTIRLVSSPAWTNDTTRSIDLERVNGIKMNASSMTARFGSGSGDTVTVAKDRGTWVGKFRATADGQASDTEGKRLLINAYNQRRRKLKIVETTNSWTSTGSATWASAHASTANRVEFLCNEYDEIELQVAGCCRGGAGGYGLFGMALDATNTNHAEITYLGTFAVTNHIIPTWGSMTVSPSEGYHFVQWTEVDWGSVVTFYSYNATYRQAGISGYVNG